MTLLAIPAAYVVVALALAVEWAARSNAGRNDLSDGDIFPMALFWPFTLAYLATVAVLRPVVRWRTARLECRR